MASVIDALVVTLGMDSSKFLAGQQKAEEGLRKFDQATQKSSKDAQIQAKAMAEQFGKVAGAVTAIGAALVGAKDLTSWISDMVTGTAQLGRTSRMLGMSARDLDAYGNAVKSFGGSAEGFAASMQSIEGGLAAWKMGAGGENIITALARLGVQSHDGKVNLDELSAALVRVKNTQGVQTALNFAQQLGLDQGTFQMLIQGPAAMDALIDKMRASSQVTKEATEAAERLQAGWAGMAASASGLGQTLMRHLTPSLEASMSATSKFLSDLNQKGLAGALGNPITGSHDHSKSKAQEWWESNVLPALRDMWNATPTPGGNSATKRNALHGSTAGRGASAAGGSAGTRGARNNNPGNIEDGAFARAHGAIGSDGRFAIFPSMAAGVAAMDALLSGKYGRGMDTIASLVTSWAPPSENNTAAYIADVAKRTGLGATAHLSASQLAAVRNAMALHESGVMIGAQASAGGGVQIETHIGTINIVSKATDANGIARDIHQAMQQNAAIGAATVGAQ